MPVRVTTALMGVLLVGLAGCTAPLRPSSSSDQSGSFDQPGRGEPIRNFPYKAGIDFAHLENDHADCEVAASQRVPQSMSTQSMPAYTVPEQTLCNQFGARTVCRQTGGQVTGGQVYTIDVNAPARRQVYELCMTHKNYQFVTLPACSRGTDLSTQGKDTVLGSFSSSTCYQVFSSGGFAIGED